MDVNSNFSLINKPVNIPEELSLTTGKFFFERFEQYLYNNQYFTTISIPNRVVFASNKYLYRPSLINPAFDDIGNIFR
jgi:hypothetical protein